MFHRGAEIPGRDLLQVVRAPGDDARGGQWQIGDPHAERAEHPGVGAGEHDLLEQRELAVEEVTGARKDDHRQGLRPRPGQRGRQRHHVVGLAVDQAHALLPAQRQSLLFSATFSDEIRKLPGLLVRHGLRATLMASTPGGERLLGLKAETMGLGDCLEGDTGGDEAGRHAAYPSARHSRTPGRGDGSCARVRYRTH